MQKNYKKTIYKLFFITFCFCFLFVPTKSKASILDTIKEKLEGKSEQIKKLESEINTYKQNLNETVEVKQTLQKEINTLDSAKKKIEGDIKLTEKNISSTNQVIQTLEEQIESKENSIKNNKELLYDNLKDIQILDDTSFVESFLSGESLVSVNELILSYQSFEDNVRDKIEELLKLKQELLGTVNNFETKKVVLAKQKNELSGKKTAVQQTQAEKNTLLSVTKNKESEYQKMLQEKLAQKAQFEKELFQLESELKLAVDPSKLPSAKSGALYWPLQNIFITQYFGATVAAKRLYTSGSHNGIDLRATDGTPVLASLSGTVTATGNTDLKRGCYSYGKWILVKHNNGLSTLYAHLSSVIATPGQTIGTGETIGLSGRTGYVTGPHLHLTVLATEGTRVIQIPPERSKNCSGVTIPLADPSAYLDPMLYLPKL